MLDSESQSLSTQAGAAALSASVSWGWQPIRSGSIGLAEQLVEHFGSLVRNHGLRAGVRLPSVRALAQTAGVSRDTVVQAYDRLAAQGLIVSRRGSGFYVASQRSVTAPAESVSPQVVEFDTAYLLRGIFGENEDGTGSAGCLPSSWMDQGLITGAMRAITRQGARAEQSLLGYGVPQGFAPLRQHIASYLQAQEVPAHPAMNLMTVAGVTQGLDLIVRCFLRPGDTVLVEDPAWFLIFGRLKYMGVNIVGVPRLPGGPDVLALESLAQEHQPKLFILNTAVHNPTGLSLSAGVAHEVLRIAERHDFLLVEDDTYADFLGAMPLRLAAMDRLQRVILVGGYSKTLSGGLRVGYIAAKPEYVHRLTDMKLLSGLTSSLPAEHIVHHILADGSYRKHVDRLRDRVDRARIRCLRKLEALDCHAVHEPVAGTFAWVDCGVDTEVLARQAALKNLLLAPGVLFSPQQATSRMLRVPVAMADQAAPWMLLEQILKQLRR
ncbi:PLP-dependent aminotransferase family protein [Comamonas sp. Y33R10-2]|uniref:aminotransferase-like domain-containing protein n=1 Tax=Comamonas sp. Y33R10-2 TaxID=2853257 RepID=UPI001C5CB16C|nr:PLP-dependent aminotransferase family protein [Comamonas sp. Y33R10-2]QXZ10897.1 PLP-dependent aminotransferase family protein [Comamonas sp. Y33R10-2]